MPTLTSRKPKDTYKDLLQISNSNEGIDGVLRVIEDGEGTESTLYLSQARMAVMHSGGSSGVNEFLFWTNASGAVIETRFGPIHFMATGVADQGILSIASGNRIDWTDSTAPSGQSSSRKLGIGIGGPGCFSINYGGSSTGTPGTLACPFVSGSTYGSGSTGVLSLTLSRHTTIGRNDTGSFNIHSLTGFYPGQEIYLYNGGPSSGTFNLIHDSTGVGTGQLFYCSANTDISCNINEGVFIVYDQNTERLRAFKL